MASVLNKELGIYVNLGLPWARVPCEGNHNTTSETGSLYRLEQWEAKLRRLSLEQPAVRNIDGKPRNIIGSQLILPPRGWHSIKFLVQVCAALKTPFLTPSSQDPSPPFQHNIFFSVFQTLVLAVFSSQDPIFTPSQISRNFNSKASKLANSSVLKP